MFAWLQSFNHLRVLLSFLMIAKLKNHFFTLIREEFSFLVVSCLERLDSGEHRDMLLRLNHTVLILCLTQRVVSQFQLLIWKYVEAVSTIVTVTVD